LWRWAREFTVRTSLPVGCLFACGRRDQTLTCDCREKLFDVFFFLKNYMRWRSYRVVDVSNSLFRFYKSHRALLRHLASKMEPILPQLWAQIRDLYPEPGSDAFKLFGPNCGFIVDSFPIRICRPRSRLLRRATYNGKYKHHVLKVTVAVSFSGVPLFWSLNVGAPSDSYVWNHYLPPGLAADEYGISDKAYVAAHHLECHFKKPRGRELTPYEQSFNTVLSFFRSTVEHSIASLKAFEIIGGRFRGRLSNEQPIRDALTVIMTSVALRILKSPLKDLTADSLLPDSVAAAVSAAVRAERTLVLGGGGRRRVYGFPVGTVHDIVVSADGSARGAGPEPSDDGVDSGLRATDFQDNERVWVWWWGLMWDAVIQRRALTRGTLAVRWNYNHRVTSGYHPKLVFPVDRRGMMSKPTN